MLVSVREKRCRARPCELLRCAPFVQVATVRLQPAGQELSPPVLAVVALLACRSPPLPSIVSTNGRRHVLVSVREKRCRARPCELLRCAPFVQVATVRLQPAGQELSPPVLAVVALLACRSPPLPSTVSTNGRRHVLVWVREKRCRV